MSAWLAGLKRALEEDAARKAQEPRAADHALAALALAIAMLLVLGSIALGELQQAVLGCK